MGIVNFSPIQDGTGDPSPTNVRPIKPGLVLKSKNLFNVNVPESLPSDTSSWDPIVKRIFTPSTLIIGTSGTNYYSPTAASYSIDGNVLTINTKGGYGIGYAFKLIQSETYTIGYQLDSDDSITVAVSSYAKDGTFTRISEATNNGGYFTVPNDSDIILLTFKASPVSYEKDIDIYNIQLELGSTPTEYEPYYNMEIYGGYVDFENGEVINEWRQIDLGNYTWRIKDTTIGDYNYFFTESLAETVSSTVRNGKTVMWYTSQLKSVPNLSRTSMGEEADNNIFTITQSGSRGAFVVRNDECSTSSEFKAWASGIKVVYPIATPITYVLTTSQLTQAYNQLIPVSPVMINKRRRMLLNTPHLNTVYSGNTSDSAQIAVFKTDMKVLMESLKVYFTPIQGGSGDPSPTNIRAISGYTGLTVKQAGINLLQCDTFTDGSSQSVKMIGTRNADGEIECINLNGTCTGPNVFRNVTYTPNTFKIMDGTYATNAYNNQVNIWLGTTNYNYKDQDGHRTGDTEGAGWKIFEVGEVSGVTRTYTLARIQGYPYATGIVYDSNVYPMMCLAQDQGCEFEPYKGIEIPISWQTEAGTLYGGYVDLVSGELVKEYEYIDLSSVEWDVITRSDRAQSSIVANAIEVPINTDTIPNLVCEKYKPMKSGADLTNNQTSIAVMPDGVIIFYYDGENFPSGGMVYKLATPVTYQLTPQQIKTFIGRNNIWSNAGNVEVKYWTH